MNSIPVRIFNGLYKEQKAIVRDVLSGDYSFVTIKAGRQSGKSWTLDRTAIALGLDNKGKEILWATPTHGQSLDAMERIEKILNNKIEFKIVKSPTDRRITFTSGSFIRFVSAERYDNLRGKHPHYLILDEFAFFKIGAWEMALKPYFIANKDLKCIVASTPSGKNDFYELWSNGLTNTKGYVNHRLHYSMNPNVNMEFIRNEQKKMSVQVFKQEYEGEFVFGNSQVFGEFNNLQIINKYIYNTLSGSKYFFGLDVSGAGEDKTVLTIMDEGGTVVEIYEVEATNTLLQLEELYNVLIKYKDISGYSEINGLGITMYDLLIDKGINVTKWDTNNQSKQILVSEFILNLNEGTINLPTVDLCPKLDNEMSIYQVSRTNTGLLRYSHPTGSHDDYVDSIMMANHARLNLNTTSAVVEPNIMMGLYGLKLNNSGGYRV